MCYSRNCPYENYWGECERPKRKPCPYAEKEEEREEKETNDRESEEE